MKPVSIPHFRDGLYNQNGLFSIRPACLVEPVFISTMLNGEHSPYSCCHLQTSSLCDTNKKGGWECGYYVMRWMNGSSILNKRIFHKLSLGTVQTHTKRRS
ncbi:uncharacterized protein [Rutidosis leptorrhynchoides]|uniref:uncharacterized protein n=1 Tax=Rutidosis leptorrhynchoides TaxID=125765 RepID=UPI003A991F13